MSESINKLKALWTANALIRGSLIYVLGSLFIKGVAFILIPLYTHVFTPANYGTMELINTIMSLLTILVTFGLTQLIYLEYIHLGENKTAYIAKINYAFNVLAVPLLLVAGLLLYLFQDRLFAEPDSMMIVIVIITIYVTFYQNNLYSILQLDERPKMATLNKAITAVIILVLNLVLVKYMKVGIIGVYISSLAAIIVSLALLSRVDRALGKQLASHPIPIVDVKKLVQQSYPFIISSIAYFGINGIDRVIIKSMLGDGELGLYSLGFRFGAMLEPLLIAPVLSAYHPHLFKRFAQGDFSMNIMRNSIAIMAVFAVIAVVLPFASRFLIGPNFEPAIELIPYFVMGFGFLFLVQMLTAPLIFLKNKRALVYNVVLSGIVNVILNLVLIRFFKLQGSSMAFVLTNMFWFLITLYQSQRAKRLMISFGADKNEF